jgi:hypothetical protein
VARDTSFATEFQRQEHEASGPLPLLSVSFFLKFYGSKIGTIENWTYLLSQAVDQRIPVYVWIEDNQEVDTFTGLPFRDSIHYITHANKHEYNANITQLDEQVSRFWDEVGLNAQPRHCYAHLKSFFLTSGEYVVHLDGDDMFYEDLHLEDILDVVRHMKVNALVSLTRPYWAAIANVWSFGFTVQKRDLLNQMFILDPQNLPERYKKTRLLELARQEHDAMLNLDAYFGVILFHYYRWGYRESYFHLRRHPYWNNSINVAQKDITTELTRAFCDRYDIHALPIRVDKEIVRRESEGLSQPFPR